MNSRDQFVVGDVVQIIDGPWLGRSGPVVDIYEDREDCVVVWLGHARRFPPERLKLISRGAGAPVELRPADVPNRGEP